MVQLGVPSVAYGPWGGPGGDPFAFEVRSWITQITVRADAMNIKSIAFRDADGQQYGVYGGKNPNNAGTDQILDAYSEYVKSIRGTYGNYNGLVVVTSLSFFTNKSTYGPFGRVTGTPFNSPTDANAYVNGFHGRGGYYLDQIGVICQAQPLNTPQGAIRIGPWGGRGGDSWSFITNHDIRQIMINTGVNIKSISFRDSSGFASAVYGGMNPTDPGKRQTVQIDSPAEQLISISGTHGNYHGLLTVTSLSFTTNLNAYGPFGNASGTSFSIPVTNGTIVGFHGRAGYYLDAIGIFVKPT